MTDNIDENVRRASLQKGERSSSQQLEDFRRANGKDAPVPASIVRLMEAEWRRDNEATDKLSRAVAKALERYGS